MWSLSFHLVLTIIVGIAGWQDWRTHEVSNFITIPLFAAGLLTILWSAIFSEVEGATIGFSLFIVGILTIAAYHGWMGGADWKVLTGLLGIWPLGSITALFCAGIVGLIIMFTHHNRKARFSGITAFALGIDLVLLAEVSTSIYVNRCFQ